MAEDSPIKASVQSVERAFELLEIMASAGPSIAFGELAARAELPQPTIHRLVRTLLNTGLRQAASQPALCVGPQADSARGAARRVSSGRGRVRIWPNSSSERARAPIWRSGQRHGGLRCPGTVTALHADVHRSRSARPHAFHRGRQGAPDAAIRRGVLALLKRTGMPASNENTHTTHGRTDADIELSRSRGYAVDEGEQEIGVRCFAVPVPRRSDADRHLDFRARVASHLEVGDQVTPLLKQVARDLASEFEKEAAV